MVDVGKTAYIIFATRTEKSPGNKGNTLVQDHHLNFKPSPDTSSLLSISYRNTKVNTVRVHAHLVFDVLKEIIKNARKKEEDKNQGRGELTARKTKKQ